jgi:hypothetical protein
MDSRLNPFSRVLPIKAWVGWLLLALLWATLLLIGGPPTAATRGTGWGAPVIVLAVISGLAFLADNKRLEAWSDWLLVGRRSLWFSIGVMVCATAALFGPALFSGQLIGGPDIFNEHYPIELILTDALRAGRLPFWNPYVFSGVPALADPQYMVLYPPLYWLRLLLPTPAAIGWSHVLHVLIGGLGMYGLARRFKLHPWISLTCGVIEIASGTVTLYISAGHVWLLYAFSWAPLAWLLITVALEDRDWLALAGASLSIALIILTGHSIQLVILAFVGANGLFICARLKAPPASGHPLARARIAGLARLIGIFALGGGLAAAQIAPTLTLAGQSGLSAGYDVQAADMLAVNPIQMLAWASPDFTFALLTGGKVHRRYDLLWHEWVVYIGVLPLLLFPLAYARKQTRAVAVFLGVIALLSMIFAMGRAGLLASWMYDWLPFLRVLRIPARAMVMWALGLTLLAGFGLQALVDGAASAALLRRTTLTGSTIALYALLIAGGLWAWQKSGTRLLIEGGISGLAVTGLLLIAAALLALHLQKAAAKGALLIAVLMVVFADLFYHDARDMVWQPPPDPPAMQGVAWNSILSGESRVMTLPVPPTPSKMGRDNAFMLGRVTSTFGYSSVVLSDYLNFYTATTAHIETDRRAADFLNVGMFASAGPVAFKGEGVKQIAEGEFNSTQNSGGIGRAVWVDQVRVIPSPEAALAALQAENFSYITTVILSEGVTLAPGPAGRADIHVMESDPYSGGLTVQTRTPRAGILVFNEPYYSERRIRVDGLDTPVLKANTAFMAVKLPAGEHTVEIYYQPDSFRVGLAISGVAGVIWLGLVMVGARQRRSRVKDAAA